MAGGPNGGRSRREEDAVVDGDLVFSDGGLRYQAFCGVGRWLARRLGFTRRLEVLGGTLAEACVDDKGEGTLGAGIGCAADAEGEEAEKTVIMLDSRWVPSIEDGYH